MKLADVLRFAADSRLPEVAGRFAVMTAFAGKEEQAERHLSRRQLSEICAGAVDRALRTAAEQADRAAKST